MTPNRRKPMLIGIDPGASGGLACMCPNGRIDLEPMPELGKDEAAQDRYEDNLWDWISARGDAAQPMNGNVFAAIERNTGFVGGGGNPGSSMFKFGTNYGILLGFLRAAGIPTYRITPTVWQRDLGIPVRIKKGKDRPRGETKEEFKRRLLNHARDLFPREKITEETADALLIAEWLRRHREKQA